MRSRLFIILGILLIFTGSAYGQKKDVKKGTDLVKFYSYEEGLKKAARDTLHAIVFFETKWCGYCKKMDATTMVDPRVVEALNKYFVPIKVDGDIQRDLTKEYGVRGYPTAWFLKADGTKITYVPGYCPADDFYWLLQYMKDDAYEKEQFKEYVDRMKKQKG